MRSLLSFALAVAVLFSGMMGLDYAWAQAADVQPTSAVGWADWIRAIWPILVVVVGGICTGIYLGLAMRFPSVSSFDRLKARVDKLEDAQIGDDAKIKRLEELCSAAPTRVELQDDIAELGERMSGIEGEMKGVAGQLGTTNTYLHTLIERGLRS